MKTDILVLTRSTKPNGYCVAGINMVTGKWIRIVSSGNSKNDAIPYGFMKYPNGTDCMPLDIACFDIVDHVPGKIQKENYLVNTTVLPEKKGKMNLCDLEGFVSSPNVIFGGTNAFLNPSEAMRLDCSIGLFRVHSIELGQRNNFLGEIKHKVSFFYRGGFCYYWSMTDRYYYDAPDEHVLGNGLIVVSIPENSVMEKYYKIVAKIFSEEEQ